MTPTKPREMMRTSHATPEEAVKVTKDVKSKNEVWKIGNKKI